MRPNMQPSTPAVSEHRFHQRLQDYWNALRGARAYPQESEIDPDLLEDIWPSCFLISNDEVTHRVGYRYSYLGSDLIEAYGDDASAPDVALRLLSTRDAPLRLQLDDVLQSKIPVIDESEFVNLKHLTIRYRTCMLPLGTGEEATHIIGCMRWKAC